MHSFNLSNKHIVFLTCLLRSELIQLVKVRLVLQLGTCTLLSFLQVSKTNIFLLRKRPLLSDALNLLTHLVEHLQFRVLHPTGALLDVAAQLVQTLLFASNAIDASSLDVLNPFYIGIVNLIFNGRLDAVRQFTVQYNSFLLDAPFQIPHLFALLLHLASFVFLDRPEVHLRLSQLS